MELLHVHTLDRALRCSNQLLLDVPKAKLKTRSGGCCSKPLEQLSTFYFLLYIRSFATREHLKSWLKTNLFSLAVLLNWEWFYPNRFYYYFKIISDVLEF